MKVTVKDIARIAGVTQPTVSKALNNDPGVSEKMRNRILTIAKELNYVPNLAAKRLAQRKSNAIGFIWPGTVGLFYYHLSNEIQQQVVARGYSLLISVANPAMALQTFNEHFVDRIICWSAPGWKPKLEFFQALQSFQGELLLMGGGSLEDTHQIQIDRKTGVYKAVKHLAELGHRNISFIGYPSDKLNGFTQAMLEFQLAAHPDYLIMRDGKGIVPKEAVVRMFERPGEQRVTALILDSQGVLFQMMKYIHEYKICIPEQLSLIVYDDVPEMEQLLEVPLTTVGPNIHHLVSNALDLLTENPNNKDAPEWKEIVVEPDLVIRQSTAKPAY